MKNVSVLLVDDNRHFLESIEKYLHSIGEHINVVGKAYSGTEAIHLSSEIKPDLILMDLAMPRIGGLEATRFIKQEKDPPLIIILTMHGSDEYRKAAEEAGADGFISKSELYEKLSSSIGAAFPGSINTGIGTVRESGRLYNSAHKV